ncbi:MAG: helix-turn-helix domain-containing protein [Candidatus Lokiarchaeota archaeon]|nr:helix-turn-helix domain-containing protein [Candidatus Lokiarchaeota archaeon]
MNGGTQPSLARIKIKFPKDIWIATIYNQFPDVKMEIQYFLPYDLEKSIGNSIVEILYHKIDAIIEVIKNHPSVFEFNLMEREDTRVKFNVKTKDPYLLYAVIKCGVLVNFPVNVRDGNAYWRLIASRERIDKLLSLFEQKGLDFELLRLGRAPYNLNDDSNKLTLEESTVLDKAIETGFFEIPRKISLEELANDLGKSKSALSVMMRKIIKKKVVFNK